MQTTSFKVSAKTARLLGRENINDADGALTELVKNAYDADASTVGVIIDIPFLGVPSKLDPEDLQIFSKDELKLIYMYYLKSKKNYILRRDLDVNEESSLEKLLYKKNTIAIFDNGTGMSEKILTTKWMNIGTDDKEVHKTSQNGRVKTGAKGIGRFALDKLSCYSTVYTQADDNPLYKWSMDWELFDNAEYIEQVNAVYETKKESYKELVKGLLEKYGLEGTRLSDSNWENGTMIVLNPLREKWTKRIFNKINKNLNSINPFGSVDQFDIFVHNINNNKYDFFKVNQDITDENYDYHVHASFNGINEISIKMWRNEIDIKKEIYSIKAPDGTQLKLKSSEFWSRPVFGYDKYKKEDYNSEVEFKKDAFEIVKSEMLKQKIEFDIAELEAEIEKVGPFEFDFYYIKNVSGEPGITKRVIKSSRKQLLDLYKGIRIYRDKFKVRPYGEEDGTMYDWLGLGTRSDKSPAAATHKTGAWRVRPYQMIGSVFISRELNSNLDDQSNRESIAGLTFDVFRYMLISIIDEFEYDRQYPIKEFGNISREILRKYSSDNKEIIEEVKKKRQEKQENKNEKFGDDKEETKTEEEEHNEKVEQVLLEIVEERDTAVDENRIYRSFAASGMIVNTFAHELKAIETTINSTPSQLKSIFERMQSIYHINMPDYLDPLNFLNELTSTNKILGAWIKIIMDSIVESKTDVCRICLTDEINHIIDQWSNLLGTRYITCHPLDHDIKYYAFINLGDLYLIFNNFLLNSVWFLKDAKTSEKVIEIELSEEGEFIIIKMYNNGEPLADSFKENPMKITELGVSTKINKDGESGTGLGMWLIHETLLNNDGRLNIVYLETGFLMYAYIPRKD